MHPEYLSIPPNYVQSLGGLRWSAQADAVEYASGRTFALFDEIMSFLEGYASVAALPAFGHVLHFLHILRHPQGRRPAFGPLADAWRRAGRPPRTTGVLAAHLCRLVDPVPLPPSLEELSAWRSLWSSLAAPPPSVGMEPAIEPDTFESLIESLLPNYSDDDLLCWLEQGGPFSAAVGKQLAEHLLKERPRSLTEVLAEVGQHERLLGAMTLVAHLEGALALPPRRLLHAELPVGGYTDVTTHGNPEQVLPGQFALDELEFLRRYAQNELLYYHREEPARQQGEQLVVLLDQGVRTWGEIRLALTAAVFALVRLAERKQLDVRLAVTSQGGRLLDPRTTSPEELAGALAGSDFGVDPSAVLQAVREQPASGPRDLVVLTHPWSLPRLQSRPNPGERLFALTVTGQGDARWGELTATGLVELSAFRIDLSQVSEAPVETSDRFTGEVEPVPFPFRFGREGDSEVQAVFEFTGRYLLVASSQLLFLVPLDDSGFELLPRPMFQGKLLPLLGHWLGVTGGFVWVGSIDRKTLLVYLQLRDRSCRVIEVPDAADRFQLRLAFYSPRWHAVVIPLEKGGASRVRLATGVSEPVAAPVFEDCVILGGEIAFLSPREQDDEFFQPQVHLNSAEGKLSVGLGASTWRVHTPQLDGGPALCRVVLSKLVLKGSMLAMLDGQSWPRQALLVDVEKGQLVRRLPMSQPALLQLSEDGERLASTTQRGLLLVSKCREGSEVACLPVGRFHNNAEMVLGEEWLILQTGSVRFFTRWWNGQLHVSMNSGQKKWQAQGQKHWPALPAKVPAFLAYDRKRFRAAAAGNLIAVLTCFGEVYLFEPSGQLLAGMFAFRNQFAAWLPDGTVMGSSVITGKEETPDAANRIGQVLHEAWQRNAGERP
jgi:hypothetical protein